MSSDDQIQGGCHCGFIKYTFKAPPKDFPESNPTKWIATRCNCTFCQKLRTTNINLLPAGGSSAFTLVSPAGGRSEIPNYAPRMKTVERYFCDKCGVHVWMEGYFEVHGTKYDLFNVNLSTVDQPPEGGAKMELDKDIEIRYYDILHNNFMAGLAEKPYPGGLA